MLAAVFPREVWLGTHLHLVMNRHFFSLCGGNVQMQIKLKLAQSPAEVQFGFDVSLSWVLQGQVLVGLVPSVAS